MEGIRSLPPDVTKPLQSSGFVENEAVASGPWRCRKIFCKKVVVIFGRKGGDVVYLHPLSGTPGAERSGHSHDGASIVPRDGAAAGGAKPWRPDAGKRKKEKKDTSTTESLILAQDER